jgi:hypothetical protein
MVTGATASSHTVHHDPTRHPIPFVPDPQGLIQTPKRLSPFVVHHTSDQANRTGISPSGKAGNFIGYTGSVTFDLPCTNQNERSAQ